MSLPELLKDSERIFLSGANIHQITKGACNPLAYHALEHITSIEQLFDKHDAVMLLYETDENIGHWTCLIRHSSTELEFFDPYGLKIDEELSQADYNRRLHDGKIVPHLTHLIEQSGYTVKSNTVRLQKTFKDVNTCGRHCALRVLLRDLPIKEYNKMFTSADHYNPDLWATAMTIAYSL